MTVQCIANAHAGRSALLMRLDERGLANHETFRVQVQACYVILGRQQVCRQSLTAEYVATLSPSGNAIELALLHSEIGGHLDSPHRLFRG
jgi:hypothetical protein